MYQHRWSWELPQLQHGFRCDGGAYCYGDDYYGGCCDAADGAVAVRVCGRGAFGFWVFADGCWKQSRSPDAVDECAVGHVVVAGDGGEAAAAAAAGVDDDGAASYVEDRHSD